MKKVIRLLLMFLIIAASLSCSQANKDDSTLQLTATSLPTYEPSATASSMSMMPTRPAQLTMVTNSGLQECREMNSKLYDIQTDYRGLIPGKTNKSEVGGLVGEPKKESSLTRVNWIYDDFVVSFEGNVIDEIVIYSDSNLIRPLADTVEKFGCPSFIFAVDTSASGASDYFLFTSLVYQNMELEFFFGKYPVSLLDVPEHVVLREPETKDQFLQRARIFHSNLGINGIVSWGEAVRE